MILTLFVVLYSVYCTVYSIHNCCIFLVEEDNTLKYETTEICFVNFKLIISQNLIWNLGKLFSTEGLYTKAIPSRDNRCTDLKKTTFVPNGKIFSWICRVHFTGYTYFVLHHCTASVLSKVFTKQHSKCRRWLLNSLVTFWFLPQAWLFGTIRKRVNEVCR